MTNDRKSLLDVNFLIALAWPNHIHHSIAKQWFHSNHSKGWFTCPTTQTAFVRISSNPKIIEEAVTPIVAVSLLKKYTERETHFFLTSTVDFSAQVEYHVSLLHGHRQVTDFYLLLLARSNEANLVTLDGKLANAVKGTEFEDYVLNALSY
jgi:uncharacterized protein